jgi:hypothetical protein
VPLMNNANMAEEISEEPDTVVLHYFVNSDPTDHEVTKHIGGLDLCIDEFTFHHKFIDSSNCHKATTH